MDERLYKKLLKEAYFILKGHPDYEDYANDAAIDWIKRGQTAKGQTAHQAVCDAIRKRLGRKGTKRSEFEHNFRTSIRDDPKAFYGGAFENIINEQYGDLSTHIEHGVDIDLFDGDPEEDIEHKYRTEGLNTRSSLHSRNSQLRKIHNQEIAKKYLWAHYKEYGIESEIEVDWIKF